MSIRITSDKPISISNVNVGPMLWACTDKARAVLGKCIADLEARKPNCKTNANFAKNTSAQASECIKLRYECSKKAAPFDPKNDGKVYLMNLMDVEADFEEEYEEPTFALLML